jgi:UPF0176 protein
MERSYPYKVILYYKFARIENLNSFLTEHKKVCVKLNLKGRVFIAQEGINGTLSGKSADIEEYKIFLLSQSGFQDTEFKEDDTEICPFVKLIVRLRPEIVVLKSAVPVEPFREQGKYLSPLEWQKVLETEKDFTLIDVRNNYESDIGYFEGAIKPDVENFYDFPQWLDQANLDKNKKVLMYCTGGIRCEKFSLFMEKKGFKDVYQLHGGIIKYAKEQGGKHFLGKCFVFDDRLAVPVQKEEGIPVGRCTIVGNPCDTYLNCANMDCNRLFLCSKEGALKMEGFCSEECRKDSVRRRPMNWDDIFAPSRKWYNYYQEKTKEGMKQRKEGFKST